MNRDQLYVLICLGIIGITSHIFLRDNWDYIIHYYNIYSDIFNDNSIICTNLH